MTQIVYKTIKGQVAECVFGNRGEMDADGKPTKSLVIRRFLKRKERFESGESNTNMVRCNEGRIGEGIR